jgi:hypothetical protein
MPFYILMNAKWVPVRGDCEVGGIETNWTCLVDCRHVVRRDAEKCTEMFNPSWYVQCSMQLFKGKFNSSYTE